MIKNSYNWTNINDIWQVLDLPMLCNFLNIENLLKVLTLMIYNFDSFVSWYVKRICLIILCRTSYIVNYDVCWKFKCCNVVNVVKCCNFDNFRRGMGRAQTRLRPRARVRIFINMISIILSIIIFISISIFMSNSIIIIVIMTRVDGESWG